MWDLPRPGLEPVSPALAGRFSTTVPPGKPHSPLLNYLWGLDPRCFATNNEIETLAEKIINMEKRELIFIKYSPRPKQ